MVNDAQNPLLFVAGRIGYNYYLHKNYDFVRISTTRSRIRPFTEPERFQKLSWKNSKAESGRSLSGVYGNGDVIEIGSAGHPSLPLASIP
jgi:hypothetical protein